MATRSKKDTPSPSRGLVEREKWLMHLLQRRSDRFSEISNAVGAQLLFAASERLRTHSDPEAPEWFEYRAKVCRVLDVDLEIRREARKLFKENEQPSRTDLRNAELKVLAANPELRVKRLNRQRAQLEAQRGIDHRLVVALTLHEVGHHLERKRDLDEVAILEDWMERYVPGLGSPGGEQPTADERQREWRRRGRAARAERQRKERAYHVAQGQEILRVNPEQSLPLIAEVIAAACQKAGHPGCNGKPSTVLDHLKYPEGRDRRARNRNQVPNGTAVNW